MGNTKSAAVLPEFGELRKRFFLQERIIDGNCDYIQHSDSPISENNVRVGIFGNKEDKLNPLGNQGIRIGGGDIQSLKNFMETQNGLVYEFTDDTRLTFFPCEKDVCYNLKTPVLDVTRKVDPIIRKFYKPMGLASTELDKITNLYKMQ